MEFAHPTGEEARLLPDRGEDLEPVELPEQLVTLARLRPQVELASRHRSELSPRGAAA
jgi:hypothetical protein